MDHLPAVARPWLVLELLEYELNKTGPGAPGLSAQWEGRAGLSSLARANPGAMGAGEEVSDPI